MILTLSFILNFIFFYNTSGASDAIFVQGGPNRTREEDPFFEVQVDGPLISELSKDYWRLEIEVRILVQTVISPDDLYEHQRNIGIATEILRNDICAYKYGTPGDDSLWTTYLLRHESQPIQVTDFGKVDLAVEVQQATVEAPYRAQLRYSP